MDRVMKIMCDLWWERYQDLTHMRITFDDLLKSKILEPIISSS